MTSLTLAAGAALGYWTGQGAARTGFVHGCALDGIAIVYDHESDQHRHFRCFELDTLDAPEPSDGPGDKPVQII